MSQQPSVQQEMRFNQLLLVLGLGAMLFLFSISDRLIISGHQAGSVPHRPGSVLSL